MISHGVRRGSYPTEIFQVAKLPEQLRHLFRDAGDQEPFEHYLGLADDSHTRTMLAKLAAHMQRSSTLTVFEDGGVEEENECIPAGYTYLAQLVAHDLVHNALPIPSRDQTSPHLQLDYRVNRLVLDTIYGGGPVSNPVPYVLTPPEGRGYQLRLGHVRQKESPADSPFLKDAPPGDIARARCPHLNDTPPVHGATDPLIADWRNDDSLILSQLTVLFHKFHNIVYDIISKGIAGPGGRADAVNDELAFLEARRIVAFVYRRIVVEDLLERLLQKTVYEYYFDPKRNYPDDWLDRAHLTDMRVPVEFSHSAFRFGHVMVRLSYVVNDGLLPFRPPIGDILGRSSSRESFRLPLGSDWLVDWSRFFDLGDSKALNLTRRLRPYAIGPMATDSLLGESIFYLDLLRGMEARVASVEYLVKRVARRFKLPPLLSDPAHRAKLIETWLSGGGFSAEETKSLTNDPPLFFFVLFEAAATEQGKRLGILGSVIVAEVISAALNSSKLVIEDSLDRPMLTAVFRGRAPDGVINVPKSMYELIKFIQERERA